MTIDRTYKCDLCSDTYSSQQCNDGLLIGIIWSHSIAARRLVIEHAERWREVEHHICRRCLADIASLARKVSA